MYDYTKYHLKPVAHVLSKECKPKPNRRYNQYDRLESKSVEKLKENMLKMEKGFIVGVSVNSIKFTQKVYDFIDKNNLEIADEMVRLKR